MKTYRTDKQYQEIIESIENGNWTQGAKECIKYGFYSQDLINKEQEFGLLQDKFDLVTLIELATELRHEK